MTEKHANVALFVPHLGCPHDCRFCDQRTIAGVRTPTTPQDVAAACERAMETLQPHAQAQIAFFGGSFTAIEHSYMIALLQAAQPYLQSGRFSGIRISTRPDAVDAEVLDILKAYGVTAVELGAQSMDDRVLQAASRGHTAADTEQAATRIKEYGFSLGLQMMTGLPCDTDEGALRTAQTFCTLAPDTVRIYPTVVLRGTALAQDYAAKRYVPPTLEQTVSLCTKLLTLFEREHGIPVIRLGLHDGDTLKEQVIAGGYHPALRELCEGQMYVNTALAMLTHMGPCQTDRDITLRVHPKAISRMIGQQKRNLAQLYEHGYTVRVKGDETVPMWEVRIDKERHIK